MVASGNLRADNNAIGIMLHCVLCWSASTLSTLTAKRVNTQLLYSVFIDKLGSNSNNASRVLCQQVNWPDSRSRKVSFSQPKVSIFWRFALAEYRTALVSFLLLWQSPWNYELIRGKGLFGSWFRRFQPIISWLYSFWPLVRQNIMTGMHGVGGISPHGN
jgi:hypothetical protein